MKQKSRSWNRVYILLAVVFFLPSAVAAAQSTLSSRPFARNVVVPQSRSFSALQGDALQIAKVQVDVEIVDQAAFTVMDILMHNPTGNRLEAELLLPVPDEALLHGFTFQGAGSEPVAQLLPKEEARRIYDEITAAMRDPALLEFVGYNLIRTSVFPVEPRGTQKVRLSYEQLLPADGSRVDYLLPRSESIDYKTPWEISLRIKSTIPVPAVYSPSHRLESKRLGPGDWSIDLSEPARHEPGPFHFSYLLAREDRMIASLFAYPDPKIHGGYFLLLAGLPDSGSFGNDQAIPREVTLVIDRSGSMKGEKIDQVRAAAWQVLNDLKDNETFRIIAYNEQVDCFSYQPVPKTRGNLAYARDYLEGLLPRGGTNIHDALLWAMQGSPGSGVLPLVLFLTDGLPTMGETSERAIRDLVSERNLHHRRIFTFGVGLDVNTPLLDKIARETRAAATFVLPGEAIDARMNQIFRRLQGPVMADPALDVCDLSGRPVPFRVNEMIPGVLPDLYEGDQLVVLGTYQGSDPLVFQLTGRYQGKERTFRMNCSLNKATTRNAFVPRLWAGRKIAVLVDAIRECGADTQGASGPFSIPGDPRLKELVDEVVRLSTEFGILTEYTSFLAREGTDLTERGGVMAEAMDNFRG
ncbi:MAG: VIT and VWA domain-containing protein, partial [Planctomycetes bacterium]|nr:VIT and VWA domain-containing protein [Planctomycetota bacterium]